MKRCLNPIFLSLLCLMLAPMLKAEAPRNLRKVPRVEYGIREDYRIRDLVESRNLFDLEAHLFLETDKVSNAKVDAKAREQIKEATDKLVKWVYESFGNPLEDRLPEVEVLVEAHSIDHQSAALFLIFRTSENHPQKAELTLRVHQLIKDIQAIHSSAPDEQ